MKSILVLAAVLVALAVACTAEDADSTAQAAAGAGGSVRLVGLYDVDQRPADAAFAATLDAIFAGDVEAVRDRVALAGVACSDQPLQAWIPGCPAGVAPRGDRRYLPAWDGRLRT